VEELLTTHELATILGVSKEWVLEHCPGYNLSSGQVRFRPSEVESWLEGKRRQPGVLVNRKRFTALNGGGEG
jgi:hypothetical protein